MISNERPSPYGNNRAYGAPRRHERPPPPPEDTLKTERLQVERKSFLLVLKENPRGRFLRITEDVGGRRDTIIIPATGLEDFKKIIEEMHRVADETPPKHTEDPAEPGGL